MGFVVRRAAIEVHAMRLLVVEDNLALASLLQRGFTEAGYAVDVAMTMDDGLWRAETVDYDVVVLDRMLPGGDGIEIVRGMRRAGRTAPVLFLTARDSLPAHVEGLDAGGDDYVVKPFRWEELLARVRALLRRRVSQAPVHAVGSLQVDPARRVALLGGEPLELTAKEFNLLHVLARDPHRIHSRADLLSRLYDDDHEPASNVLEVYVSRLRRSLRGVPGAPEIRAVRGLGYELRAGKDHA